MQTTGNTESALDSRARGLANLKPWTPGQSGNPSGRRNSDEIRKYLGQHSKRAMERIVELMESTDERVAMMAAKEVMDRVHGKTIVAPDDDATDRKNVTINIMRYADPAANPASSGVQIRTITSDTQNSSSNPNGSAENYFRRDQSDKNGFAE